MSQYLCMHHINLPVRARFWLNVASLARFYYLTVRLPGNGVDEETHQRSVGSKEFVCYVSFSLLLLCSGIL